MQFDNSLNFLFVKKFSQFSSGHPTLSLYKIQNNSFANIGMASILSGLYSSYKVFKFSELYLNISNLFDNI